MARGLGQERTARSVATCGEQSLHLSRGTTSGRFPPRHTPYSYEAFKAWFARQTWADAGMKLRPDFSWFDVDGALRGKFRQRFDAADTALETSVAKAINRFLFMRSILYSGDDGSQCAMGMHLLILHMLKGELTRRTGVKALDIGCGTGWLLKAFALMSDNPRSDISGFDVEGVDEARRLLADPRSADRTTSTPPPRVFRASLLDGEFGLDPGQRRRLLPPASFDVINVGVAIAEEDFPILREVLRLLKPGGVLTIPVCGDPSASAAADRKRTGSFRKYRCDRSGQLVLLDAVEDISFVGLV